MSQITVSTEVDRSAEYVFAYAVDPTRFSESGRASSTASEVVHVDPRRTWGARGIDGPVRAAVDVTVEPVTPDRCGLTITVDFEGHGIGKLLAPIVVQRAARKETPGNLATLKQRLEHRQGSTPAG